MDTSSSSEELSSSECDLDDSSCEEDTEKLETAKICGTTLQLPQGLCENKEIFKEFFSLKTWNSLSEINKQHLKNFLPCFPDNDEQEKNITLQKLFNREQFRFNSPLMQFHEKLKAGDFRPDIAKMRRIMKHEKRKECKYQQKIYYKKLMHDLMISRHRLLDVSNNLPPGVEPRLEKTSSNQLEVSPKAFKTKRRYFQELAAIKSQVDDSIEWSEDENYPEGPPVQLSKRLKRHLNGLQSSNNFNHSSNNADRVVTSTLSKKPSGFDLENSITSTYNPYQLNEDSYKALLLAHKKRKQNFDNNPELNTKGITLRDISLRTQLTPMKKSNNNNNHHNNNSGNKSNNHNNQQQSDINKEIININKSSSSNKHKKIKNEITNKPIISEQAIIKATSNSEPDLTDSDSFIDPVMSPTPQPIKTKNSRSKTPKPKSQSLSPKTSKIKLPSMPPPLKEFETFEATTQSGTHTETAQLKLEEVPVNLPLPVSQITETISPISQFNSRIIPATLSDLDGIDMMNLPVDLDDSNIDILEEINVKQELMQETHSNFLSLIRDIICSTIDHRMSLNNLEDRLKAWNENPISPLNDWYSAVDSWVNLLPSAIAFLSGETNDQPEDFVPYLEYKPMLQVYQWIGAGRDSDNLLGPLCQYWLEHRDDTIVQTSSSTVQEIDIIEVIDKPQTPPPPRCPTQWSVRKAEPEEIEQFREQERQRYSNPHKAFTYRMNGYESVVGPVKGMYNQNPSITKARGHSMLSADRPNFVTILTLVRDATARLPNGEGTRADICELLKSSQYISQTAPENVLQSVVSGALDRMHTEYDPCVKYDTKRKIWIYLHRNRTEADFERIHQQVQGMSKQMKKSSRKSKSKKQDKNIANNKNIETNATTGSINSIVTNISTNAAVQAVTHMEKAPAKNFKTPISKMFTPSANISLASSVQKMNTIGTSLLVSPLKAISSPKSPEKPDSPSPQIPKNLSPITSIPGASTGGQQEKQIKIVASTIAPTKQDIEEAIQTLTPIGKQISSPKGSKSLVKIINSPQGKSLITSNVAGQQTPTVFIKQIDQKTLNTKQMLAQPQITQQLLQTLAAQQQKIKLPPQTQKQQPIIVATTHQLLKSIEQKPVQSVPTQQIIQTSTVQQPIATQTNISQQLLQAINQQKQQQTIATVTATNVAQQQQSQQQQILQSIKQKVQNQQTVLSLQQAVLKQQANLQQLQKQLQQQQIAKGTSLLGQQRIITQVGTTKATPAQNQTPLVAKVLTNAAGQVISVESLLAHQKQHGSLPQGTTLRVSSAKSGQTNLIQLSGSTANQIQQFAVVSQNNIVSIAGQPRLATVTTQPLTTTTPVTTVKTIATNKSNLNKQSTKFVPSKQLTHQLVNAKFITTQNVAGNNKLLPQQKIVVNQPNQIKINATTKPVTTKTISANNQATNTVRMVNTTGLNLAHLAGKPVLLAKGNTLQNLQSQNVILQTQQGGITTSAPNQLVLPNNTRVIQAQNQGTSTATQVMLGAATQLNQIKMQNVNQNLVQANTNQIVLSSQNLKAQNTVNIAQQAQGTVVLGSAIKMQTGTQNNQRVVLASQGQGGQLVAQQILLPSGFQGGAINIKTLQGLKVIPLAQAQTQAKGRSQQVFARIMNPANASRLTQVTQAQSSNNLEGGGSQGSTD